MLTITAVIRVRAGADQTIREALPAVAEKVLLR